MLVPHVPLERLLPGWPLWLVYWEWLLLCNDTTGEVIVHAEDFDHVNMKSEVRSLVDIIHGGTCEDGTGSISSQP